ncbi:MAG: MlaD family protein [Acidobacteria bacterium]|nr:MlaD family protein [Acidobacteriota bacterium]
MQRDSNTAKVGLTVLAALVVLAAFILAIGDQSFLFRASNSYRIMFPSAAGLLEDNPVQLNGVTVGKVDDILLSERPDSEMLEVRISVERRYANRLRRDSLARIKTLGLLGDKYVEITSGSPDAVLINPGEEIPAALPTDVDDLIASGADVVDYVVSTAQSLSTILGRMERGEGLLGELVASREDKRITDTVVHTLESIDRLTTQVEAGEGVLGRLLTDEEMGDQLASTLDNIDETLALLREGDGLAPALLRDGELKTRFESTLAETEIAAADLRAIAADLRDADGLLPRLLTDEELSESLTTEVEELLGRLNSTLEQVAEGDGTAARLINDPAIYQALDDLVVGINESRLLRWLVRNRQKAGIKKRYREEQDAAGDSASGTSEESR